MQEYARILIVYRGWFQCFVKPYLNDNGIIIE